MSARLHPLRVDLGGQARVHHELLQSQLVRGFGAHRHTRLDMAQALRPKELDVPDKFLPGDWRTDCGDHITTTICHVVGQPHA